MKKIGEEKGYALIVVLLMIVLFLGVSATFLAGSLNHATQERTVDTSNQAVAAAEMGVLYYTEDFNRAIELLKKEILLEIQRKLDEIAACGETCNKTALKTHLDTTMKQKYTDQIIAKVNYMEGNKSSLLKNSSADGKINYTVSSAQAVVSANKVDVTLKLKGKSNQGGASSEADLNVEFDIEIPASFLNTTTTSSYEDVYRAAPSISCNDFLAQGLHNVAEKPYNCNLGNQPLKTFINTLTGSTYSLNPEDFRVYTNNYLQYVCNPSGNSGTCNSNDFQGIAVVVNEGDNALAASMNGLTNINLFVSGLLKVDGNVNSQAGNVLVLKELEVRNNIQKMSDTYLVVLGYENRNDARLFIGNNFTLADNSRLCFDLDRILGSDIDSLEAVLKIGATSSVVYYTTSNNTIRLQDSDSNSRVFKKTNYSEFLNMCGISASSSHTVPNVQDSEFEFEVEY